MSSELAQLLNSGERLRLEDHRVRVETKRARELFNLFSEKFHEDIQNISWGRPTLSDVYFAKTGKTL